MTGDKKKENRWAKVLDDAGLLDDVDDAWELPDGGSISDGATIEVRSSIASTPATIIESESGSSTKNSRDDVTQKVITVMSSAPPGRKNEDTLRVSYTDKESGDVALTEDRISKMPLSPVRRTEEPLHTSSAFIPRTDTDPGQFARHSGSDWSPGDNVQPQYAVPADDNMGWDTLMDDDDERPTLEVPTAKESRSSITREVLVTPAMGANQVVRDVPSREETRPQDSSLSDAVARMQASAEQQEKGDRFIDVRGARISVQAYEPDGQKVGTGSIMDVPVSRNPEPIELAPPSDRVQMAEKYDLGDFSGALEFAEKVLFEEPNDMDAMQYRKSCRDKLLKMFESRIGDMERTPQLLVNNHELMWRNLDASAGFVLSRVDGISTYDNILDISGMPKYETCEILNKLLQDGLIE